MIEPIEDTANLLLAILLRDLFCKVVDACIFPRHEDFFTGGAEAILVFELVRNGAGEVLHDCPAGVSAELIAT